MSELEPEDPGIKHHSLGCPVQCTSLWPALPGYALQRVAPERLETCADQEVPTACPVLHGWHLGFPSTFSEMDIPALGL